MTNVELRSLRAQLLLVGGLVAGCIVAAVLIATQRWWFESFLVEKYPPLPANLSKLAKDVHAGQIDADAWDRLSNAERLAFFDDWMANDGEAWPQMPPALAALAGDLYAARAERTLVCGGDAQRARALEFLRLAHCAEALPCLDRARCWAQRRCLGPLADDIAATMAAIRVASEEGNE